MKALKLNRYKTQTRLTKTAPLISMVIVVLNALVFSGCKKSLTDGVVFAIGTNNFKYTAFVKVTDAGNKNIAPGNLAVTVSGPNSNLVYDLVTGKKKLTINPDGTIQLLISPTQPITAPVYFNLTVTSPGYLPYQLPVTITPKDSSQTINIPLKTPATSIQTGTIAGVAQFKLTNGKLPNQSVVKIAADNTVHAVTSLQQQAVNSFRSLNSTSGNGSTPAGQVTYYDDGLTSVVLPQGTTFHYWTLKPTGVIITDSVAVAHVTSIKIPVSGVAQGSIAEYKTYYTEEAYSYPQTVWVQESVAGSTDSIGVVVNYTQGDNISTKIEFDGQNTTGSTVHTTLTNQDVPQNQLLFRTAVEEKLLGNPVFYKIHHSTTTTYYDFTTGKTVTKTVAPYIVYDQLVSPDQSAQWFTSFVIDPNVINPVTNAPIKDGDQVEIGTDSTNTTVIQTVKKAANGQLRVQMLSYDAGFFYKAPYVASFNYTINSNGTSVADPENAFCYISLLGGDISLYFDGEYPNYGPYSFSGQIASAYPISSNSNATAYYWGKQVFTQNYGLNATVAPFSFTPPYPTTTFYIAAYEGEPASKGIVVTNTPVNGKSYEAVTLYSTFYSDQFGSGQVSIRNGYWATNAFPVGANITGTGYADNYLISLTSYITTKGLNSMYWDTPKF